ncbi:DUF5753 domain-containing protein [Nocardiopsis sp. NPDC007018]|uniref:DUF5753 domain-containing protein n=1 Tax=Nocardiopsis sp. NPDC007018 TaxID=3155721 RepID=UPI0033E0D65F
MPSHGSLVKLGGGMAGKRNGTGGSGGEWKQFGKQVGELREVAGLSAHDLVMREVCEASELRRVEEGSPVPRHLAEYLDRKLNAQGSLVNAWARSTLNTHLESGARPHELDSSVSSLREFHPGALPTTVQTHAYATALRRAWGRAGGRSTTGWNSTASLRVVVNEAAVRTPVGGTKVMREQLSRLISSMRGGGLCLQVIPAVVAEHPCPMGPFRLLSLGPVYTVAHLVSPCGDGQLISAPQEARAFADLFEDLRGEALPVSESLDLLVHIADSLKPQEAHKAITSGDEERALAVLSTPRAAHR